MEKYIYRYLLGLKNSDFQIVEGEPNIIGWEVKSESDSYIGEVNDLLFDPESRSVRYLVIDLKDNGMELGDKKVMIPIGTAHLHTSDDEVVLPNITASQLASLPAYDENSTVPATEVQIREVIGSPQTQREREIEEFNQNEFYAHEHFDKNRFYQRGGSGQEYTGDRRLSNRKFTIW
ncbi:PRC-barrel domain containing protein [Pedobacter polaris]|uniref:PRC-barrel domain containing protein n=1 Tax=Pedobacter polaris TaxID=2571273 RepID=A0A4U1CSM6_9SPHI|nr:PRC-barrel domain-containing protein [Pedobacter polaris]TKC10526.1 PRC-barrel domain containing protein [Pedobacter polaris]